MIKRGSLTTVLLALAMGCSNQPVAKDAASNCVALANGYSQLPPCWLSTPPGEGLVLSGQKHFGSDGWLKTRQDLLQKASLEFAILREGQDVSTSSTVVRVTEDNNGQVRDSAKVATTAEFKQSDQAVNVKAAIKDFYYRSATETLFVWVIEKP